MPDIVDLLETTARSGHTGVDLVALEARATTLRRHQNIARVTAVLSAVLLVPLVLALPDGHEELQQLPATEPTSTASANPGPSTSTAPISRPVSAARGSGPAGPTSLPAPSAAASEATQPSPSPAARQSASATSGSYPPAASCHVSTRTLLPGAADSCRFTATQRGGWRLTRDGGAGVIGPKDAVVEVVRDGVTRTYTAGLGGAGQNSCADTAVEPGDRVTVTVRQSARGYQGFDLGAGAGYSC